MSNWKKVFKIFLRLKWEETIGSINWKVLFGAPLLAVAACAAFLTALFILGLPVYYIFNFRPDHCENLIQSLLASGFIGLVCCAAVTVSIHFSIRFCKWIRLNWREAKRLAEKDD